MQNITLINLSYVQDSTNITGTGLISEDVTIHQRTQDIVVGSCFLLFGTSFLMLNFLCIFALSFSKEVAKSSYFLILYNIAIANFVQLLIITACVGIFSLIQLEVSNNKPYRFNVHEFMH